MDAIDWFQKTTRGDSINAVAFHAGVVQSTLNRQVKNGSLTAEMVISISRAYGTDVISSLLSLGIITDEDVRKHDIRVALGEASNVEISLEVVRRLGGSEAYDDLVELPDFYTLAANTDTDLTDRQRFELESDHDEPA